MPLHIVIADATLAAEGGDAPEAARAAALHLVRGHLPQRALPLALRSAEYSRALGDISSASDDYLLALRILGGMPDAHAGAHAPEPEAAAALS